MASLIRPPALFGPSRRTLTREIDALREQNETTLTALTERLDEANATTLRYRHMIQESRQTRMFVDGRSSSPTSFDAAGGNRRDKETLYEVYKEIAWVSAAFDVIARRIVSGGIEVKPLTKGGDPAMKSRIEDVIYTMNDEDDIVEMTYRTLVSLLLFAEAFWEQDLHPQSGEPFAFYYVDPVSIDKERDKRGNITAFVQKGSGVEDDISLTPAQVIYFKLTGPRGEPLGPLHKLMNTSVLWAYMVKWATNFFRHGAKPPFGYEMPERTDDTDADRFILWHEENYAGVENAHKPFVGYGGIKQNWAPPASPLELDFLESMKYAREEFLAVIGAPPAELGVNDDGNRLSDQSEAADKRFRNSTVAPLRRIVEEKLTYRICKMGFQTDDWAICCKEADYLADTLLIEQVVSQVNAGLMPRKRAAERLGLDDPGKGSKVVTITLGQELVPIGDLDQIHGSQFTEAQDVAISKGLDPHEKPEDLADVSPNDPSDPPPPPILPPGTPGAKGTVPPQRPPGRAGSSQSVAKPRESLSPDSALLADLVRWQRLALKAVREGAEQRPFTSESLDPWTLFAVSEGIDGATSEADVRRVFDVAFEHARALAYEGIGSE